MNLESERYNMCKDQLAQIDCRDEYCKYHIDANCTNISPAITISASEHKCICWSKAIIEIQKSIFLSTIPVNSEFYFNDDNLKHSWIKTKSKFIFNNKFFHSYIIKKDDPNDWRGYKTDPEVTIVNN